MNRTVYLVDSSVAVELIEGGLVLPQQMIPFEVASREQLNSDKYHRVIMWKDAVQKVIPAQELAKLHRMTVV